ncbi:MAG: adaptor protein MecA [Clostridia bacterium]|nr:adaptor protein MecA [Clostridia bacterium]
MELIRIGDSKLKIMLTAQDMARYAITPEALDYENTETRRAVWQILDEAKQKTGFDAASDRVLIQVYPSRTGGCELYVTKVLPQAVVGNGASITARLSDGGKTGLYAFFGLPEILTVCSLLLRAGYSGESAAYAGDDGRYYLLIREKTGDSCAPFGFYCLAEEYGEKVSGGSRKLAYIKEHGKCLCPSQAVERLAALA